MTDIVRVYNADPSLFEFHASDKPIRCVRGAIGSGKSVAMVMELLRRACEMPASSDGIRRSRTVITRNTLAQLKSTCLVTIQEWLRPIIHWKVSDSTITVSFTPADGIPVFAQWILLPLDTPDNINRLLSLEITTGWVSEFREVPLEIMQALFSRCGRYPSPANMTEDFFYGVIAETNSFSEDSEYYNYLELERPENVGYFIQPGGRDPNAPNIENLPSRYYSDLIESNTPEWVSQYIDNRITASLSGQAVWQKSFLYDFHTAERLEPDYNMPIIIGMDTGRNPAAVIGQVDSRGRMLVFSSIWGENMGMEKFIGEKLRPHIMERLGSDGKYFVAIDPAARQRSQIGEESVLDAVKRLGFAVVLAPTNDIAPRLRAVERYLHTQVQGGGGLLIDRRWNKDLIRAVTHDYRYKRSKDKNLSEVPEKGHPESDLADGLQYLCLSADSTVVARELARMNVPKIKRPVNAAGWT